MKHVLLTVCVFLLLSILYSVNENGELISRNMLASSEEYREVKENIRSHPNPSIEQKYKEKLLTVYDVNSYLLKIKSDHRAAKVRLFFYAIIQSIGFKILLLMLVLYSILPLLRSSV